MMNSFKKIINHYAVINKNVSFPLKNSEKRTL
jgi:DNA mismatch repair ATPase MutL